MRDLRDTQAKLRAALWSRRAARAAKSQVGQGDDLLDVTLPSPPPLEPKAIRGVRLAFRLSRDSCLIESLVLQEWHRAHGTNRDLIVGVGGSAEDFKAHAWLDGEEPSAEAEFVELLRRRVPR